MRILMTSLMVILLAACGGGGSQTGGESPLITPGLAPVHLDFPLTAGDVQHTGIDQTGSRLDRLPSVGERGGAIIRYGTLHDGAGRETVAAYLSSGSEGAVHRFHTAPEVRVIGPSTARERAMVDAAVEAINLSLPLEYRMQIGAPHPGLSFRSNTDAEGYIFYPHPLDRGTIYVEFLPCAAYHGCGRSAATSWSLGGGADSERWSYIEFARGTVSHGDPRQGSILLAHEFLHSLGMDRHVSQWLNSIVRGSDHYRPATATILTVLDREGMQALYGRLEPGDDPTDFGPWASTSSHIAGNGAHANFGVAMRNGYAEPWAHGPSPRTVLVRNTALSGRVTWEGALVGLTPQVQAVIGDAAIAVELATLMGRADFTGLEHRVSGATWLDGDLGYIIAVSGNTFRETGGDDGTLTGIFTGRQHEGAAGTLERTDLTAAFGASR